MIRCARETGPSPEGLYGEFELSANPTMRSVEAILRAAGLRLCLRTDMLDQGGVSSESIAIPTYLRDRLARQAEAQGGSVYAAGRRLH